MRLVAAIVAPETDAIGRLVDEVWYAGGDDSGDYAALAAAWRAGTDDIDDATREQLREAGARLQIAPPSIRRLPDFSVITSA